MGIYADLALARFAPAKCHDTTRMPAQFRPSRRSNGGAEEHPKDRLEKTAMNATKATEQSQDSRRQTNELDNRYGKIGISAVAAALRHQGEQRTAKEPRFTPYERD